MRTSTAILWRVKRIAVNIVAVCLIVALLVAISIAWLGSTRAAVGFVRGQAFVLDQDVYYAGDGAPGELRDIYLVATNITKRPLRLTGTRSSCTCVVLAELPIILEPGDHVVLRTTYKFMGDPGRKRVLLSIYSDSIETPIYAVRVEALVRNGSSQSAARTDVKRATRAIIGDL